jgi:hypothetical protein
VCVYRRKVKKTPIQCLPPADFSGPVWEWVQVSSSLLRSALSPSPLPPRVPLPPPLARPVTGFHDLFVFKTPHVNVC